MLLIKQPDSNYTYINLDQICHINVEFGDNISIYMSNGDKINLDNIGIKDFLKLIRDARLTNMLGIEI